ncbi:MAG: YdbL family protein [Opitutaceae bacterium]|nr:YdbL family protein [Opitutaceae bacterium]
MKTISRLLFLLCLISMPAVVSHAEDLGAIKARMNQRLAQLDQLKASGAIGENNQGYVEVRADGGDAAAVVAAENADRRVVYTAIASQAGASADQVGRARARQIAAGSAPGVWLQDESGRWYKK